MSRNRYYVVGVSYDKIIPISKKYRSLDKALNFLKCLGPSAEIVDTPRKVVNGMRLIKKITTSNYHNDGFLEFYIVQETKE